MLTFSLNCLKNSLIINFCKISQKSIGEFSVGHSKALKFGFSTLKKSDRESSESLLKQYFSSRLTLSTSQLEGFLVQLSKNNDVKIRDHRWESLYMTVEKYHKDFSLQSKIEIIQALGRMKQNNQLFLTLYKSIVAEFHKLAIEQMAILLWSMVKAQQNDKTIVLAIYKKLHKIMENDEKIKLYKESEELPFIIDSKNESEDGESIIHHMHESSFVHLLWSIQKTKTIDEKLILDLLKFTFKEESFNNLEKLRIENLCLLAYCMEEMKFEKYRISQTIINQIMKEWEQFEKLNLLTLVLLCGSFSKFVFYQQQYLSQYESKFTPEEIIKKQEFISKERQFIFFIVETIFLRQNRSNNKNFKNLKRKQRRESEKDGNELVKLTYPLSSKFASQIILQLGKLGLYDKNIWYKLLSSITDEIDQAEIEDLSMALTGICKLNIKEITSQEFKAIIYPHKKILCRRVFQIYTSLTGRSLNNIKELVFEKQIETELVPSRIRKEIEQEFMAKKMEEDTKQMKNQENPEDISGEGKEERRTYQEKTEKKYENREHSKNESKKTQTKHDDKKAASETS